MTDRKPDHAILPIFTDRWSPRAFDPRPIDEALLHSLFEAARWSPSSLNIQPWRFVYVLRDDPLWESAIATLMSGNQLWARNASALVFILSDTVMDYKGSPVPSHSHSFDAGAAWMALALQATSLGLITHGMAGVDFDKAKLLVKAPNSYRMEAAIAIGYPGEKAELPPELQQRETPSTRRPVTESIFRGTMEQA
jgi:nitroreductase